METRANFAMIGAFTLAVIASAFFFVFWFSGTSKTQGRETYRIIFEGSVSGLSRGATVLFNGLRVGEVQQMDVLPNSPSEVYADITVDSKYPINRETKARLEYQGLTGVASVALTGGAASAAPLPAAETGGPRIIRADRSDYQNVVETLQRLSGKADGIMEKIDKVVGENQQSINNIVKNFETLTGSIEPAKVRAILDDAQQLTTKLNKAADQVDGIMAGLNNLVGSDATKGTLQDIAEAAKSVRKLADNLDSRTKELTAGINRFTGAGLRQFEALASDGRRTLDELNRTMRSLEKNPQQLIFGAKPKVPEYSGR